MTISSQKQFQLLIVDDDELIIESLKLILPSNWGLTGVQTIEETQKLKSEFDAAFVDMHLVPGDPRARGLEVISLLRQRDPHMEIVAISGDLDRNTMEKALQSGANRFLAKPLHPEEVQPTLEKIESLLLMQEAHHRRLQPTIRWIGPSEASGNTLKEIARYKGERGPILIEGESGTGKELVATLLNSQERTRPFVTVNVAAISENLFESELFGHVRGAFTGADQNKMGLAELAHGGDLFLDEIEALPMNLQPKLLRFLESGEIKRVGAKESLNVQVRVIAASNRNIEDLVREEKFREDLWWRFSSKVIRLTPLRDRRSDIEPLANAFISKQSPRHNKKLTPDAVAALLNYDWPGNVRELLRVCEQVCLTAPLPIIRSEDILSVIQPKSNGSPSISHEDHIDLENLNLQLGLAKLVAQIEKRIIERGLNIATDIENTAKVLKISRSSLYKKIKEYQLSPRKDLL